MGIAGDPTEAALLVVARKAGMNEYLLRDAAARFDEIPSMRDSRAWPHCITAMALE